MSDHPDLPLTGTHWGVYRAKSENGRVTALHGFEEDRDPSPIGQGMVDAQDGPARIRTPMVRKSWLENGPGSNNAARGSDPFVPVSWDEAERLVAEELDRVRKTFGNSAIFGGSYGWASAGRFHHAQSQLHRFLNCIGGYTKSKNAYSFAAAEVIVPHVLDAFFDRVAGATSWKSMAGNTELFVAFGGVPLKNSQVNAGGVGRHRVRQGLADVRAAGCAFVDISPLRSDLSGVADAQWLAPRPNTDTAILLAIAHALLTEDLHDRDFIERYTTGFERFQPYLTGERDGVPKDADWAAAISELPAQTIRDLARRMAGHRTMLSVSWSLTRQDHGEHAYWAAITVAAMLGQIGLPGGGIGLGYGAMNCVGDQYTGIPGASLPQGTNPVENFIPVARISDMLLNPGDSFDYNGGRYTYPDIHLVYWAGGNPFHHHQDLNRLLLAWRKPDTVIVHDWCWNAVAKRADIVLPCTTTLEREDIFLSPRDPYLVLMRKVSEPVGEARNDFDIFSGIARHMRVNTDFTDNRTEAEWLRWMYAQTRDKAAEAGIELPAYEQLLEDGWFKAKEPAEPTVDFRAFRDDPVANPLSTPSGRIEIFSETIAGFGYDDCPGHAFWTEPAEWLGSADGDHRLHLISNQPSTKLHSQYDQGSHSRAGKIKGRELLRLHPADAEARGIRAGDILRVFNDRGACLAAAVVDDTIRRGVVQISTGAWFDPQRPDEPGSLCKHGNVNVLTPDRGTSRLAQGPIAHTCLVEVERFEDEPPPVTAHDPPIIVDRS